MYKKLIPFLFTLMILIAGGSFKPTDNLNFTAHLWVQQELEQMSLDEKIGQLFMIRAHSDLGPDHIESVKSAIEKYYVGGLCFFQGTPLKQAELTNSYQQMSKIPLMIAIDGEWGLGMRFPKDAISFPRQLMLGAIQDNALIYEMGREIAYQLSRIGVHVNFAPVADVNNNINNPVIHDRSFGESRYNVAAKSFAYMKGMQDAGILACAKHFPGHGDTELDSHFDLPVINHDRNRLDSIELMPFRVLSQQGIGSMMIAHLQVPALDDDEGRPTSLSAKTIKNVLKKEIGFNGLIFTDGLEMEGVNKKFGGGMVSAEAFLAGNDILLLPKDIGQAVQSIKVYIKEGKIKEKQIDLTVSKILYAKYRLGLFKTPVIELENLVADIHREKAYALKAKLIENALTIAAAAKHTLPLTIDEASEYISISIGESQKTEFQNQLESITQVNSIQMPKDISRSRATTTIKKIPKGSMVIVGVHDMNIFASKKFGISTSALSFIEQLNAHAHVVLCIFGSPYSLTYFEAIPNILVAYNNDQLTQELAAQALFGGFPIRGKLPVTAGHKFSYNSGIEHPGYKILINGRPQSVGMNGYTLTKIDTIVEEMINEKAAPGCQVLIAKDGRIVFHKAYGNKEDKKTQKVKETDLYDVASITKIAVTTLSVMKLYDEGLLDIDAPVAQYLLELDTTNKKDLIIRDIMAHHAGLVGWIPFYRHTLDGDKQSYPSDRYYRTSYSDSFSIEVAEDLYLRTDYKDTIWQKIITSPLMDDRKYLYSDLGFYLMAEVVQRLSGMSIDEYADLHFYGPLGLRNTCYNPSYCHAPEDIIPSEKDEYFRNQILRGYVHDMGAAMMGGVSGHAGLFSNAGELAVIMQMLLNGGEYGGKRILNAETVYTFTRPFVRSSRRAIGFDGKQRDPNKSLNMAAEASDFTFGHMGFTGACAWADPKDNIVYIFLSNRTFPSMENKKFIYNNYRSRVQQVIYQSMH